MIILDTNVVSETQKKTPNPNVIAWLDSQDRTNLYLTSVTVGELMRGVFAVRDPVRFERLAEAVGALIDEKFAGRILPYDEGAARAYGMRTGALIKTGTTIPVADGNIAAIAIANGRTPVATRDRKHFDALDVPVIDPWNFGA